MQRKRIMRVFRSWWRHQMETFSALLAICAGNSPIPCEFPAQRPVTRSFDVFFDLRPNKRLSKQWWRWWFEMPSSPLWRHCNDIKMPSYQYMKSHCVDKTISWPSYLHNGTSYTGKMTYLYWIRAQGVVVICIPPILILNSNLAKSRSSIIPTSNCPIVSKFCAKYDIVNFVLCAKFENGLTTAKLWAKEISIICIAIRFLVTFWPLEYMPYDLIVPTAYSTGRI